MTARFTAEEVLKATKGQRIASASIEAFTGISTDTRSLTPGALFVALAGDRFDGHDFLAAALRQGAAGFVVSRVPETPLPEAAVFLVEDTRTAYQDLARFHRSRFGLPVIAVGRRADELAEPALAQASQLPQGLQGLSWHKVCPCHRYLYQRAKPHVTGLPGQPHRHHRRRPRFHFRRTRCIWSAPTSS